MSSELGGGSAPLIHLSCFGGLQVTAETPLGPGFLQPRVVAVLAIVAAAGAEGVDEARLLQLLWPDHITADRLFPLLTPTADLFFGAYAHFQMALPESLK